MITMTFCSMATRWKLAHINTLFVHTHKYCMYSLSASIYCHLTTVTSFVIISTIIIISQKLSSPNPPCKSIMCPPASHEGVGVNDSWIMHIILRLLSCIDWVKTVMRAFPHISPTLSSVSLLAFLFWLPQHLIMIVPVSLACIQHAVLHVHGSGNDTFHNPVSPFC